MKTTHLLIISLLAGFLASCAQYSAEPNTPVTAGSIPLATAIEAEPNMVISPYKPYNKIDVKGYKSGETVGDPSTAIIDPKTGKANMSTVKAFLIP